MLKGGPHLFLVAILGLSFAGCEERFLETPPFPSVADTVKLGDNTWFFLGLDGVDRQGAQGFPFSYRIFNQNFDGYLLHNDRRLYLLDADDPLERRLLLLDYEATPGDTLFKFASLKYFLLLDRKRDENTQGEVFYVLRRSKISVKSFRERSVWAISPLKGIVAAAEYDIDDETGSIRFDYTGDPTYFEDPGIERKIKLYDYNKAHLALHDRDIRYEFDKQAGVIRSRNYRERRNLNQHKFSPKYTRQLIDFELKRDGSQILLATGDSCYYFTPELVLKDARRCP